MKKIRYFLVVILLICTSINPVNAVSKYVNETGYFFGYYLCTALEELSEGFYKRYGINIVVEKYKSDNANFDIVDYANNRYEKSFGNSDGIIFMFNEKGDEVDKYINVYGNVNQYFDISSDVNTIFPDNVPGHIAYTIQSIVHQIGLKIDNVEPLGNIVDMANLLKQDQIQSLEKKVDKIARDYQIDVAILTTYLNNGKEVVAFADDYYDENNYGFGDNKDGLLLVLSLEHSDWYVSTSGQAINLFTDWGIDYLGEVIVPDLSKGNYYESFDEFLNYSDKFIAQGQNGKPYDRYNHKDLPNLNTEDIVETPQKGGTLSVGEKIFPSIIIGFVAAFAISYARLRKLKTKKSIYDADNYIKNNSFKLTKSEDLHLYNKVTKKRKPVKSEDTSTVSKSSSYSNSSRTVGSSTHRSSSGNTHGGRGGKF